MAQPKPAPSSANWILSRTQRRLMRRFPGKKVKKIFAGPVKKTGSSFQAVPWLSLKRKPGHGQAKRMQFFEIKKTKMT
jgi:hypothetical protein